MTESPKFSLKGWSFWTWLAKNATWVKTWVASEAAAAAAHQWSICGVLAVGMLAKLITDVIDFWLTANPGKSDPTPKTP